MTFQPRRISGRSGSRAKVVHLQPKQVFFSQGDPAVSIFYLRTGRAKLTVLSPEGKEGTVALLNSGEFIGEESLASVGALHMATATAFGCLHGAGDRARGDDPRDARGAFPLRHVPEIPAARSMRTQADLVDQLFNSSEKRLARILLLMAEFGEPGEPEPFASSHHPGNSGGDDRHHPLPRQLLHESLSQARPHRLQRPHPGP
jgi:CRP/FNR family cyclic AMP-dependent transcriptional regulator